MRTDRESSTKMRKKILPLVMGAVLVLSLLAAAGGPARAEPSGEVGTYGEFAEAVADPGIDTIHVTDSFDLGNDVAIARPVAILADSACTINADEHCIVIGAGGDMTMGGNLAVADSGEWHSPIQVQNGGRFTLAGGAITVEGDNTKCVNVDNGGIAEITGGTITATGGWSWCVHAAGGTVNLSGGTLVATGEDCKGIYAEAGGTANITGGTIEVGGGNSGTGLAANGLTATVNISGGAVSATGPGNRCAYADSGGTVNISGGTIVAGEGGAAVFILNSSAANIAVSPGIYISGAIVDYGTPFLTSLSGLQGLTVTLGEAKTVELEGAGAGVNFAVDDEKTDAVLNAEINAEEYTVTLEPPAGTASGAYSLALTARRDDEAASTLSLIVPVKLQEFAGGDGSPEGAGEGPYQIATPTQLNNVRNHPDAHYILTADINLTDYLSEGGAGYNGGQGWLPIGTDEGHPFTGTFDGGNKTISGLFIGRPGEDYIGLFGCLSGTVRNLKLTGVEVTGRSSVGGLAGENKGAITGSLVSGAVTSAFDGGSYYIGGLVGENDGGAITSCSAAAGVTADCSSGSYAGGLAGYNADGAIESCYATGSVTGNTAGGLAGYNADGAIESCYATGSVTGNTAGGLVGNNHGAGASIVRYCYAAGAVTGTGDYVGGLVAYSGEGDTVAASCYNSLTAGQSDTGKGEPKASAQMVREETFGEEGLEWDFDTVWAISEGASYPYLQNNVPVPLPAPPHVTGVTVSPGTLTLAYGGGTAALAASVDPAAALAGVAWSSDNEAVATVNSSGVVTPVGFGEATITATTNDGGFTGTAGVTVNKKTLTVGGSFTAQSKEYDGSATAATATDSLTLEGVLESDAGAVSLTPAAAFDDKKAGDGKTVSLTGASTLGGAKAGNYTLSLAGAPTATADITAKMLTVGGSFTASGKVYDGTAAAAIATNNLTLPDIIPGDTVSLDAAVAAFDGADVGTGKAVSLTGGFLTGGDADDYTLSLAGAPTATADITAKTLTVGGSFTASGKIYDGTAAAAIAINSLTLPGVVPGDTVSLDAVAAAFNSAAAGAGKTVGLTGGSLTGDDAGNYTLTLTGAPMAAASITPKTLTVGGSFAAGGKVYDGTTAAAIAVNSLTLEGVLESDAGAVGLAPVAAFADANTGEGRTVSLTDASSLNGDKAGSYVLSLSAAPETTADIARRQITVTADAKGKTHGAADPALTYRITAGELAGTDAMAGTLAREAGEGVGSYNILQGTLTAGANYEITFVGGTFTISPRAHSGGTPPLQDYNAGLAGGGSLPVTVDTGAGSAALNLGTLAGDIPGGGSAVVTVPSISGVNAFTVNIPASSLSGSGEGSLTINTDIGSIAIPGNMLSGMNLSGDAGITIGTGDKSNLPADVKEAIGDRPLIQLTLTVNGMPADWNNTDAPVTVSIPYTPTAAELSNPEGIVIWYVDGSGNVVTIPNGRYDAASGTVTFAATHFSGYAVAYNHVSFKDVAAGAWYNRAVGFIAARGITGGTGNGNYSPDASLTRGEFIVLLMRAYGISPDRNPADNFTDAGGTYYTGYLAAAKRLGISAGAGNNMYAPGREITRQEMFTLLYNALKIIGQLPKGDSGRTLTDFTDAGLIGSWAKDAVTLLVKAGAVGGNAGKLTPAGTTTRAEMAQVLYNLLGK